MKEYKGNGRGGIIKTITILIHGEVSDDDGGGVGWRDHGHVGGHGIATGHGHRVARGHTGTAGHLLGLRLLLGSGTGRGRGRHRGLRWLLQQLLWLEGCDVNHRVRVDLPLGGAPGRCSGRAGSLAGHSFIWGEGGGRAQHHFCSLLHALTESGPFCIAHMGTLLGTVHDFRETPGFT